MASLSFPMMPFAGGWSLDWGQRPWRAGVIDEGHITTKAVPKAETQRRCGLGHVLARDRLRVKMIINHK
jgi:hypothetical protein